MARLEWDLIGERAYEMGVDRGVLNVAPGPVFPWNGLISINESSVDDSELRAYLDGVVYANLLFGGFFQCSVRAFGFPDDLPEILGLREVSPGLSLTAQHRAKFNFSYRTLFGENEYKVHLVYNATASQKGREAKTIGKSSDAEDFLWDISAVPPASSSFRPSSHMVLNSKTIDSAVLLSLETALYGSDSENPYFPTQDQVIEMFTP